MSSALWFERAKAALALVEWLENLRLAAGVSLEIAIESYRKWDPAEVAIGHKLLEAYRRATPDNFTPAAAARAQKAAAAVARAPRDRRKRADAGRETDARDASAGNLVK